MNIENKFKAGKIILPGINVEVNLRDNQFYRNDGLVKDIDTHGKDALGELEKLGSKTKYNNNHTKGGHCMIYNDNKGDQYVIMAVKEINNIINIFNTGHESTHAICALGQKEKLTEALKRKGFKINPFKKYKCKEEQAHLGGLFALYLQDEDVEGLMTSDYKLNKVRDDFLSSWSNPAFDN